MVSSAIWKKTCTYTSIKFSKNSMSFSMLHKEKYITTCYTPDELKRSCQIFREYVNTKISLANVTEGFLLQLYLR